MKRIFFFLTLSLSLSAARPASAAEITVLGNGYSCSGSSIVSKGKTVSYTKAKSNTKETIANLKQKAKGASPKKKAKINAQIATAKLTLSNLLQCKNGGFATQVDPVFTALSGNYAGTYTGNVALVGPINGPMQASFSLSGTLFYGSFALGGPLGSALQPINFSGDVGGVAFPAQIQITNTFLGTVNVSITQSGQITVSSSTITFTSALNGNTLSGNLNGTYSGLGFSGSFSISK